MTCPTRGGRRDSNSRSRWLLLAAAVLFAAACGNTDSGPEDASVQRIVIGGIPDQDPDRLQRQFGLVAEYLTESLGIDVSYAPVAEYDAAVSVFRIGDLDLVWFGGLTGVQARLQVDGARAIAQRDIDEHFTSVFIAATDTGIQPLDDVVGLAALAGRRFTFGSDSSTSGRLMPQAFLAEAGVGLGDFDGEVGFSGSHDATIKVVEAGSFEVGALSSAVWDDRVADGDVDTEAVVEIFRTPEYVDYHWVARPELGDDMIVRIQDALLALDANIPEHEAILDLFSAASFIRTDDANYGAIEAVAREIGKIEG